MHVLFLPSANRYRGSRRLLTGEAEWVGLVEDDDGVQSFVFGHIAGGDAVKRQ
jgi:hypothetical protein